MIRTAIKSIALALFLAAGAAPAFAQGTAITYQGQLKSSGSAVNSPSDFRFSLFDAASGGTQVGSTVTQNAVAVENGLFTTPVDFGVDPYASNQDLFLQIEVRNPAGVGSFVAMGTRQLLTPAPFSLATRGITVDSFWSNVGIGTSSPEYRLHVRGTGFFTEGDAPYGLFETDGGSFGPQLRLKHNGPGGQDWVMNSAGSGNGPSGSLLFVRSGSPIIPLAISTSDNVGIGTTTPANRLSVAGNANVTGNVGIGTEAPAARLHNVGTTRLDDALQFGVQNFTGTAGSNARIYRFGAGGNVSNLYLDMTSSSTEGSLFIIQANGSDRFHFDTRTGAALKTGGGAWAVLSDERTKTDIQPMTGTLDRLLKLKGHAYSYKPEFVENGRALPGMQIGLVAQEVETVFPDWVTTGQDGLKQVTERSTTALMVEAMRDLRNEKDAEINELKARLERLEALLGAQASQKK